MATTKVRIGQLFSPPQGFLLNGKISVTVASNNITVAIKTLAGADPSATDPVYCRIGDTVRTITAALSVTKNAGTNWFDAGSAASTTNSTGLATQEIDYFVYLGYNATDGVVIGFARIPYARIYGDFSTTTTNQNYCAISTITNAISADQYQNIGRFNATLSGTASFNWSIPATSIIINRPIFETRFLIYAPFPNQFTLGNGVLTGRYQINGKRCVFVCDFKFGSTSSLAAGQLSFGSVPFSPAAPPGTDSESYRFIVAGHIHDSGSNLYACTTAIAAGERQFRQTFGSSGLFSNTSPIATWATGDGIFYNGEFEI